MHEPFPQVLAREIDKIVLKDVPEVRGLGDTMADLDVLINRYGPWTTLGVAREKEMERALKEGKHDSDQT